ncbi:MAG: recombinase RecT [Lachnospiraceae bacterium]|nr:recombinase RecT [Lachnospiraceae bacterium]
MEANKQTLPASGKNAGANTALANSKKLQFSTLIKSDAVQKSLSQTLGDAMRAKTFTSSLISAVSTNPALRECDGMTIISAALLGESLNLSPSPQLGQYYIVPFKDRKAGTTRGTFQLGWKGYYQLALRSGQYKNIDAVAIKEGELRSYDPITNHIEIDPIGDEVERENAKTIGYYAFFELINGFKKELYWSKEKMVAHAEKYSMGYKAHKGYTFWEKDFDGMALKTMYRQLIGKYGIMSVDMQKAYVNDMSIQPDTTKGDAEPVFFDAVSTETSEPVDSETGEVKEG